MKRLVFVAMLATMGCKIIANDGDDGTGTGGGNGGGGQGGGMVTTSSDGGGGTTCMECDDGNACTVDVCTANGCESFGEPGPIDCTSKSDGAGLCVWDKCVLQKCDPANNGDPCFAAGGVGICKDSLCGFCTSAAECDDGNPCTLDYCMPGGCYNPEDTMMSECEGGAGHCFKSACCVGCIDVKTMSCVPECPNGAMCTPQGTCPS